MFRFRKKLGIWGWWQGENLGDQWIRKTLKAHFPKAVFLETSVQDFSPYDFVICGGGGLFIFYVEPPWDKLPLSVPYGAIGLGCEFPHPDDTGARLAKDARFFYIRDQYSLDCMHITGIERSYDITFSLPLAFEEKAPDPSKLLFIWRDGHEWLDDPQFKEYLHFTDCRGVYEEVIARRFRETVSDELQTYEDDMERRIEGCGFVISGRYHGIIAAIQKGLPFIAIDVCPKLRALTRECGLEEYCIKLDEADRLEGLIDRAISETDIIREKEKRFRTEAHETLVRQIAQAKDEIRKVIRHI